MAEGQGLLQLFTTQFTTNVELLLQQKISMLRGRVMEQMHVGKQASPINQVGAVSMKAPAGRFAPLLRQDADFFRRWVFPQDMELSQLVDSFDELKTPVDPKSWLVQAATAAVGRAWDDAIIAAFFGTAQTGQDASSLTAETFDTSKFQVASTFGSSAASGLTVAKIIEARRILRHFHNELETDDITMVIGSQQESDLMNQTQVVSTEFNDRPVLVDGRIRSFLGVNIVMSERLSVTSNVRNVPIYVKSGMHLGVWQDMSTRVDIRTDLSSLPWQVFTKTSFGSTRLQAGKVVSILCSDSTGTDITP